LDFKATDKIDKNFIFNVEFEELPKWTINPVITNPEGGKVELSKNPLYEGETCRITVTPNDGWKIKSETWKEDGVSHFNAGYILDFKATDKIDKNFIFNVEFARAYKITAISDPSEGGTIKLSHNEAAEGETVKVTVNANQGYKIVDIIPEGNAPFDAKHVNDNTYEFTFEMANKDVKFKVSYEKVTPVNVTFDANGGTGTMDIVKVLPNEEITLPVNTFERDGYSFDGWDINGTSYKAGDKVKIKADIAVKAMWLINAYELTFDTNYPEANLKPVVIVNGKIHVDTIDFNTEFSIGVNDFDNENYAIDKVLVDNAKVTLTDNSFSYTMPSHDVKIEVDFVKKLSVSFDANGASGSIDSFKVLPNEEITLPANTFVRDGYSFDGWSINDASYKAGEKVKVTSDIVVKANWKVNSYNLTFESNYNEANLKPIVILKGKDFNGKIDFDDEFLLNLYNYDKENYQIVKTTFDGKEIDNDLSKVYKMPSHDAKIIVTFVKKLVVTFDVNGGKGSIDTLKVMPNDEIKLPKNSFTRSGYTFKGWDIDGKTYKVNDTVVIEKDTTIKAKWSKNPDPAPTNDDNNNNNDSNDSGNNDSNSSSSQGSDTKKAETAAAPATVTSSQAKNTSSKVTTDEAVTSNDNAEEDNDSKVETKESKDEETKEVSKSDEEDQPASLAITDDNVPEGNSNTNTDTNEPETDNTDDGISALELVGIISAFIIALLALIVTVSASVRRRRK
ncbi:MAG: InlB B-repeat-containing protein, partial [Clostridia bacterium]|nr:InlB B-repeat-containing protein [Clostridia bacterium]